MNFTNDYMILPEKDHFIVFVNGQPVAWVDNYDEAYEELRQHGFDV